MFFALFFVLIQGLSAQESENSFLESCPDLNTISTTVDDRLNDGYLYVSFLTERDEFRDIDNICHTLDRLPEDNTTYILYESVVRSNGIHQVLTARVRQAAPGKVYLSTPVSLVTRFTVANLDCGTNVVYSCTQLGGPRSYMYGITLTKKKISDNCLKQVQKIVSDLHLTEDGIFALPMKLPARCIPRGTSPQNI